MSQDFIVLHVIKVTNLFLQKLNRLQAEIYFMKVKMFTNGKLFLQKVTN